MSKTYSLSEVINIVLEENGIKNTVSEESTKRQLYRAFDSLLERLGASKDTWKKGGKNLQFEKEDLPFIKALLSQLYLQKGTAYKIISKKETSFSSDDILDLLISIIDEMDQTQLSVAKLIDVAVFYAHLFGYFPINIVERCHQVVNHFSSSLVDLTVIEQYTYMGEFLKILEHEFFLRMVESSINIKDLVETLLFIDNDAKNNPYSFCCPDIRETYIERDKNVLEKIQQDPNLRTYIETSFGLKVEEIFSYLNAE